METLKKSSLADWVENRKFRGLYTFSFYDALKAFPSSDPAYLAISLSRLSARKIIISPAKGFYVIVPTEYALNGIVAPTFYIDRMMEFLGREYYVALLSAAEFHGAAHQRPQTFSVVNSYPDIRDGIRAGVPFMFVCSKKIDMRFVERRKGRLGGINVSSPELTMADLVANEDKAGGLGRVCSVIADLAESASLDGFGEGILSLHPIPAYQRLGYILEFVLAEKDLSDHIHGLLAGSGSRLRPVPLKPGRPTDGLPCDNRWKVIENQIIDIEE